jgi:hypothetical protein
VYNGKQRIESLAKQLNNNGGYSKVRQTAEEEINKMLKYKKGILQSAIFYTILKILRSFFGSERIY